MCLIIATEIVPPLDLLKKGQEANNDGAGVAFVRNKRLHIVKSLLLKAEDILKICEDNNPPYLIHFRLRSAGTLSDEMCHPFYITKNICLAHNGHIFNIGNDSSKSDTYLLVEKIKKLGLRTREKIGILLGIIGGGRFAVMDNKGNIDLYGSFEKYKPYIWVSNRTFESPIRRYYSEWWVNRHNNNNPLNKREF